MQVRFTGQFASLQDFADRIREAPKSLVVVSEQLAEETIALVREGFEHSSDPYGRKWADLKLRAGRPLEDKGGLKAGWHRTSATSRRFRVANAKSYAIYHQRGTGLYGPHHKRIVAKNGKALKLPGGMYRRSVRGTPIRQMVPNARGRLPWRWRKRYVDTAREVLTELFR